MAQEMQVLQHDFDVLKASVDSVIFRTISPVDSDSESE